jgi:hypothetical protein
MSLIRMKEQAAASAEAQKEKYLEDIKRLKQHAAGETKGG